MDYLITSERLVAPKAQGEILTDAEISEMGVNLDALIEGGHLTEVTAGKPAKQSTTQPEEMPNG